MNICLYKHIFGCNKIDANKDMIKRTVEYIRDLGGKK